MNKCHVQVYNVNVPNRMVSNVTFSALSSGRKRPFVKHLNVTCSDKNSRRYVQQWFISLRWFKENNLSISLMTWCRESNVHGDVLKISLCSFCVCSCTCVLTCWIFSGLWAFRTLALHESRSSLLAKRVLRSF